MAIGSNNGHGGELPLAWETTDSPSAFSAEDWVGYRARVAGIDLPVLAPHAILTCLAEVLDIVAERYPVQRVDFLGEDCRMLTFEHDGLPMTCAYTQKGSPSAGNLEQLVALGARHVVFLGGSGALVPEVEIGSYVVTTAALRDDGVSQHYEAHGRYTHPSAALTAALREAADDHAATTTAGPCWTITAYFRETRARIEAFGQEGCLNVNNEAAGLFSVGRFRGVDVGAVFGVGDTLYGEGFAIDASDPVELYPATSVAPQLDIALAGLAALPA